MLQEPLLGFISIYCPHFNSILWWPSHFTCSKIQHLILWGKASPFLPVSFQGKTASGSPPPVAVNLRKQSYSFSFVSEILFKIPVIRQPRTSGRKTYDTADLTVPWQGISEAIQGFSGTVPVGKKYHQTVTTCTYGTHHSGLSGSPNYYLHLWENEWPPNLFSFAAIYIN